MRNRVGIPTEIKDVTNRKLFSTETYWQEKSKRNLTFYVVSSSKKKRKNIVVLTTIDPLLGVTIYDDISMNVKKKHLNIYHFCVLWILSTYKNQFEDHFFLSDQFIQRAKSSIKTILAKIFKQNVDYAKVGQFSTPRFNKDDIIRKLRMWTKNVMWNGV